MANVLFKYGTPSQYAGLGSYDENSLYFIQESGAAEGVLYKGATRYSPEKQIEFVDSVPGTLDDGKIYVVNDGSSVTIVTKGTDGSAETIGGGTLQPGSITDIGAFDESVLVKSDNLTSGQLPDNDTTIPTSGAVKDAIDAAVKKVQDQLDTLDPQVKASINGVSVGAADSEDKFRLTFTRTGGTDPITIDLDKEKYIQDAKVSEDGTKLIITVFTSDGQGGSSTKDIEIPLSELTKVDASTVKTTKAITVTTNVGNFTKGQTVDINDLQTILTNMLSQEFNPTRQTPPTVTLTATQNTAYEVGTKVSPTFTCSLSKGSYVANGTPQDAGVTAKSWTVTCGGAEETTNTSGTFAEVTVADGNNNKVIKAVAVGSEGAIPKTNFGNNYDEDGTLGVRYMDNAQYQKSSGDITGFRAWFMYIGEDMSPLDSAVIRGYSGANKGNSASAGNKPDVPIPAGTKRVMIAIPEGGKTLKSVIDVDGMGLEVITNFVKTTVSVEGVDGYTAKNYNVWTADNSNGLAATKYTFTIG